MTRSTKFLALTAVLIAAGCDRQPTAVRAPSRPLWNVAPTAVVNLTVLGLAYCNPGACVYNYRFDAYQSADADGSIVSYKWVENGVTVSTSATRNITAVRAYEDCEGGTRQGTLTVTDNQGTIGSACYSYTPPL